MCSEITLRPYQCVSWEQAEALHEKGLSEPVLLDRSVDIDAKFDVLVKHNNVDYEGAKFLLHHKRRVEINSLTTKEILSLSEAAFEKHSKKVLPDREHLEGPWQEQLLAAHIAKVEAKMRDEIVAKQMLYGLLDEVKEILANEPNLAWGEAVRRIATKTIL